MDCNRVRDLRAVDLLDLLKLLINLLVVDVQLV